jgi:arabinose-5-phosphate isomerase
MGFGIAGVVDPAGRLIGAITDGDLRRHFADLSAATAEEVMTLNPVTVSANMYAEEALQLLNEHKITGAFVIEPNAPVNTNVPVGIVHIHDFLRLGLS